MPKASSQFVCQACGSIHAKWAGRCDACSEWNSIVEEAVTTLPKGLKQGKSRGLEVASLSDAVTIQARASTGIGELDRVLGGGLVAGSAILIGGDPGIGKSTLLLQAAASLSSPLEISLRSVSEPRSGGGQSRSDEGGISPPSGISRSASEPLAAGVSAKREGGASPPSGKTILYISGEESLAQIQLRAQRLGLAGAPVMLATATSVREILATIDQAHIVNSGLEIMPRVAEGEPSRSAEAGVSPPSGISRSASEPLAAGVSAKREGGASPPSNKLNVVIIDSIQTMFVDSIESAPGTVAQVRAASHELIRAAKKRGFSVILVGHVTKDGQIAGPRVLEHMVDTVLYFEGDRGQNYRILRAVKNRFGATDEIGVFAMGDAGLREVKNPSALFLHDRAHPVSGAAVFAGMEGTRPMLAEIQALVSPSGMSTPRRATVGFDNARMAMILAVLETRAGMRFADKEVFLSVTGGLKLNEPAADVAAALALVSALLDKPLPPSCVSFGEIGLTGEIRAVSRAEARLKEATSLGFTRAVIPASSTEKLPVAARVAHVDALVRFVLETEAGAGF